MGRFSSEQAIKWKTSRQFKVRIGLATAQSFLASGKKSSVCLWNELFTASAVCRLLKWPLLSPSVN